MTTINNNLTIEQMREIVSGAPEMAFAYDTVDDEYMFCGDIQDGYLIDDYEGCFDLNDLRIAIAKHDLKQCQHGYDIACLICGFGTENGVRVWRKQIESDEVTDIRNHVSPSTRVVDL